MPGAAEMYMGFMKYGVSLMGLFFLCIMIPSVFRLSDAFAFLIVLVWFYGFFHARNLAAYDEGSLYELHDEYIWESFGSGLKFNSNSSAVRKWAAIALIFVGVMMLWGTLEDVLYTLIPEQLWRMLSPYVELIPQLAVSGLIIFIGIKLIQGKKEVLDGNGAENENH